MATQVPAASNDSTQTIPDTKLIAHKNEKTATYCGRKIGQHSCISQQTFYIITTVIGVVLLAVGILALTAHIAPTFFQKMSPMAFHFASKLGSDLFGVGMFATVFGFSFALTGSVGLCAQCCENNTTKKAPSSKPQPIIRS